MKHRTLDLARALAQVAGTMDLATGILLVLVPGWTLGLMGLPAESGEELVYLRWIGAFVGAVGGSYWLALVRGGAARLQGVLETTTLLRAAAGGVCAVAVAKGWLEWRWVTVAVTDLGLVAVQVWLLRRGGWSDA